MFTPSGAAPEPDPKEPYPTVRGAIMLTLMAIIAAGFTGIAFIDFGVLAAVGIGQAIGVGAVATLAAQRVPEPQAERLGLRALDPQTIPILLCLVPMILLASELDNIATDLFSGGQDGSSGAVEQAWEFDVPEAAPDGPASEGDAMAARDRGDNPPPKDPLSAEGEDDEGVQRRLIDPDDPATLLQAIVVMVGISPIVEEFLFRGVIQQGLIARMGLLRGVSLVALLWTLLRPAPIAGFPRFVAAAVASFAMGWILGMVRIATGSILGPILLASTWAAIGLAAVAFEGRMDWPGLNVPGSHLPVLVAGASLMLVGWAGWTVYQEAVRQDAEDGGPSAPSDAGDTNGTDD